MFIGSVILVVALVGGLIHLSNDLYDSTLVVKTTTWTRTISVEVYQTLYKDTLESEMPSDAFAISRYTDTHWDSETCYRWVWDSDGDLEMEDYDCSHWDYDARASYSINRWAWNHDLVTSGSRDNERVWAEFKPSSETFLGAERESGRSEVLVVSFQRNDNKQFANFRPATYESWCAFIPGQSYTVKINRLETIQWATLSLVDAR